MNTESWETIVLEVLEKPAHEEIWVDKAKIRDPEKVGFKRIFRFDDKKHYGLLLGDKKGLHIKEYEGHYAIHWDYFDGSRYPIQHLRYDAPAIWISVLSIIGAAVEGWGSENRVEGMTKGAVKGFFIGLITKGKEPILP